MKIMHIALFATYNDYWGYQENLLLKYQRKMGHDVSLIVSNKTFKEGSLSFVPESDYYLNDGQHIIRLAYKEFISKKISKGVKYFSIYKYLEEFKPDLIMIHGLSNISVLQVSKYKKRINRNCKIIADNHVDYYNGASKPYSLKDKFYILYTRLINKLMQKNYDKVYGVTPWRVQYQKEIFKIPSSKSDLLVMGGDVDKINFNNQLIIKSEIRQKWSIDNDDFLLITGGKIDFPKNIHLLMQAINEINNPKIKLLVFGTFAKTMSYEDVEKFISDKIQLIGWIDSSKVYDYFLASDLGVFPGTHSVLWEQACACGLPCIFKKWQGMQHVDVGGNSVLLDDVCVESIKKTIIDLVNNKSKFDNMKHISMTEGVNTFSYATIAKKSIEVLNE